MKRYDLIIGFGNACSCSQILRAAGLQYLSFPFDWVIYSAGDVEHDLRHRADIVANDFRDWLRCEDLKLRGNVDWHDHDIYLNEKTGVLFNHEFSKGANLAEEFPKIAAKYDRRIRRMMKCMRKSKDVLIVRIDRPDQEFVTAFEDISYLLNRLEGKFPSVTFDVLHLTHKFGVSLEECKEERLSEHVTRMAFNYKSKDASAADHEPDIQMVATLLRERYEVLDYRTRREKRAHHRVKAMKKYARYGASSYLQYRAYKLWWKIREQMAMIKGRRYSQIITLGVNCEVAFRFYLKWGFLDSSLFAWSQTFCLHKICETLLLLDRLFAGAATFSETSKMWKCEETGVFFHGQLNWARGKKYTQDDMDSDLKDLRGRVGYLREKFLNYLRNEKDTLIVHRLSKEDQAAPDLNERICQLEKQILDLGGRNVVYLFVCEDKYLKVMPAAAGRNFRSVKKFNPCDRVTDADAGDTLGWRVIFSEFAPLTILPKKHSFKFE